MVTDRSHAASQAFSHFTERFREDASFSDLVRKNIGAALAQAGIPVPRGVTVAFAPSPAAALNMTLDHVGSGAGPSGETLGDSGVASRSSGNTLDDSELLDVVAGAGASAATDVKTFLGLLKIGRT